jgi:AcrR family transcriptional regulator
VRNKRRQRLSRQRVLETALAMADADGLGAVSMRNLAQALGVEAMSIYNHVTNKNDLLDGMLDRIFAEIVLPKTPDWRRCMRERAISARRVLVQHPWAIGLLDSRSTPGPATLRHHDWVIGVLRKGGFSLPMTAHAFALLDSFIYGFVMQESSLPSSELPTHAREILNDLPAERYPHLVELTSGHLLRPSYDFNDSFEFGLELVLDGLENFRTE